MKTTLLSPSTPVDGLATIDSVGMSPSVGGVVVGLSSSLIEATAVSVPKLTSDAVVMVAPNASVIS